MTRRLILRLTRAVTLVSIVLPAGRGLPASGSPPAASPLSGGVHQAAAMRLLQMTPPASEEGDAQHGKELFEHRCTGCHMLDQNRTGPRLRGVFGRTSGKAENFNYSDALKKANIVWNEETLDKWLTDPDAYVPGNNMELRVAKPQDRKDLIRFLKESSTPQ